MIKKKTVKEPEVKLNGMGRPIKEPEIELEPEQPLYSISITIGDTTLEGQGKTAHEALASIKPPVKITTKTYISLSDGIHRKELMFMPDQAKKLFHPHAQYLFARNFAFLLK